MAKRFKGIKPKCQIGDEAHLWSGEPLNVEAWVAEGQPEMWQEVDSTSVVGKEAFYCFRLDFDVAFGSLRIVDSQNKILSVGKDCVYVETESYTIVGLGDYFISKPTIFCKWK